MAVTHAVELDEHTLVACLVDAALQHTHRLARPELACIPRTSEATMTLNANANDACRA